MRTVVVSLHTQPANQPVVYVIEFYQSGKFQGKWPTNEEQLAFFVGDWLVNGKRPR